MNKLGIITGNALAMVAVIVSAVACIALAILVIVGAATSISEERTSQSPELSEVNKNGK